MTYQEAAVISRATKPTSVPVRKKEHRGLRDILVHVDNRKPCQVYAPEDTIEENFGANPVDDDALEALAGKEDDPTREELKAWIESMNLDEQCRLVALSWLGRGDYAKEDWAEAVVTAQQRHSEHTGDYLLGMPLLADYLEEGLAQFDLSCEDFKDGYA